MIIRIPRRIVCHIIAALMSAVVVAPVTWMVFDRDPPYHLDDGVASPNPARPGDPINVQWRITVNKTGCHGQFTRSIIDANKIVWAFTPSPTTITALQKGRHITNSVNPFPLPSGIAIGPATIKTTVVFVCNPIHEFWPVAHYAEDVQLQIIPKTP